jgi:hypothetical protein
MSRHLERLLASAELQTARPVQVHIERLSLIGLPMTAVQSQLFGFAVTTELQRLARAPGWPADAAALHLPGALATPVSSGPVGAPLAPAALGREVARSVFQAVRGLR